MSDENVRVLLVEDNPLNARMVEELLRKSSAQTFEIRRAENLVDALNLLVRYPFEAILLDLVLPDSEGIDTFLAVQRHAPGIPIVVLTGVDDEALALKAVAAGAQDFLAKSHISTEALVRAVTYAVARMQNVPEAHQPAPQKAVVAAMIGAKGGVGNTTLISHFAVELHRQSEGKTLLIDLDPSGSGASFLFRTDAKYTVADAAEGLHRLDADLWKVMVCPTPQGVDLLRAPGAARGAAVPSAERVRHVVRFAATLYDWILIDLGRLNASTSEFLEETRDLFLVTTFDLPSLYESQRILQRLTDFGFPRERLHLMLNRHSGRGAVSPEDIERALAFRSFGTFADASDELVEAYSDADFLCPNSGLRKQVARSVSRWLGREPEPESSGGVIGKWIGRRKAHPARV